MNELNLKRWAEDIFVIEGFEVAIKGFSGRSYMVRFVL